MDGYDGWVFDDPSDEDILSYREPDALELARFDKIDGALDVDGSRRLDEGADDPHCADVSYGDGDSSYGRSLYDESNDEVDDRDPCDFD